MPAGPGLALRLSGAIPGVSQHPFPIAPNDHSSLTPPWSRASRDLAMQTETR